MHVAILEQLPLNREDVVLGVVDEDDPPGRDARDLAAELGADRSSSARNEHDLAGQVGTDALELHEHRLASEHVLDLDLAHLARQVDAAA